MRPGGDLAGVRDRRCSTCRRGSGRCWCCATCSASARPRWPACSTPREDSVTSALKRARATLATRCPTRTATARRCRTQPANAGSSRTSRARSSSGDVDAIVALLTDDAWLTMPPLPLEYQGHAAIAATSCATIALRDGRRYRLIPTAANGQPAFGSYIVDPRTPIAHAHGLIVLTLSGDRICALTRFVDNSAAAALRAAPHAAFAVTSPAGPPRPGGRRVTAARPRCRSAASRRRPGRWPGRPVGARAGVRARRRG